MRKASISTREFTALVRDILHTEEFRRMKRYRHHKNSTLYDHSVKVAFLCYKYHKKHPRMAKRISLEELTRAAILHDYYLYDLHGSGEKHKRHWVAHPKTALANALSKYPSLTGAQQDMIKNHMFPLTLTPPKTEAGWLISVCDKIAAVHDRYKKRQKMNF